MCVSAEPTSFSKTVVGVYEAAADLHVAFYGNTVQQDRANWIPRPPSLVYGNALLLPIFGEWETVKSIDLTDAPNVLKDIRAVIGGPSAAGFSFDIGTTRGAPDVVIEQIGIYTIVRARNASLICDAVESVEERKRPRLNRELFDKLAEWYKDVPFAVCCFDDFDEAESTPIAFSYKPLNSGEFRIYMLDAHDGGIPKLDEEVDVDHTIFAGSYRMPEYTANMVEYRDELSDELRALLPTQVVGRKFEEGTTLINGDVVVSVADVVAGEFKGARVVPPNAPAREPVALPSSIW